MARHGYVPARTRRPLLLRFEMTTRAAPNYVDFAAFGVDELRKVGIEVTLKQIGALLVPVMSIAPAL